MNEPVPAPSVVIWSHPYGLKAPPHGMASDSTALASAAKVVGLVDVLLISGVLARRGMKVN